jgi:predicted nucleic acid-binding protein
VAAIVISDASPLIALARVNGLLWLQQLFTAVVVTDVVLAEVLTGRYPDTEAPIEQALAAGWLQAVAVDTSEPALPDLDEGDGTASIRLALGCGEPALLLIDERAGRAVAQELGLSVAGTAAVIGLARQRGLIASARDVFTALHASDFRVAPAVIQAVLDRCGE